MTNYSARFIKNDATITQPLCELVKANKPFLWSEKQDKALKKLHESLTSKPVMSYFDPEKGTEIVTGASSVGLATVLIEKASGTSHTVVAYASRALTAVEQRYSQTEREALAVIWACKKFLVINSFTVITDHKPLVSIYGNPAFKRSARLQRWTLRLQPSNIAI